MNIKKLAALFLFASSAIFIIFCLALFYKWSPDFFAGACATIGVVACVGVIHRLSNNA